MNIRESLEQERASSSTGRESVETADAAKERAEASPLALDVGRPSASVATALGQVAMVSRLRAHGSAQAQHALLQLQRRYGNRHVQQVLRVNRQSENEEEEELQARRQGHGEPTVAPEVEAAINRNRGGGKGLEGGVRHQMESSFGADFSSVRIHTDSEADTLNHALGARAFTVGNDVFFRQGEYAPSTPAGKHLLAHELTHVIQQNNDRVSGKLTVSQPSDPLEREAEETASRVVQDIAGQRRPKENHQDKSANTWSNRLEKLNNRGVLQKNGGKGSGGKQPSAPAPTATIGNVSYRSYAHRIAPTKTANVAVTVSNLPAGGAVDVDVQGSGGAHGVATITAGGHLTGSGTVTVTGGATQTAPAHRNTLRVRARHSGSVIGRSHGFTVAAFPLRTTIAGAGDVFTAAAVGGLCRYSFSSDGAGTMAELSQCRDSEQVGIHHRDNPPFTSAAGTSTTSGTSGYMPFAHFTDTHSYGRASINTTGLAHGSYRIVYKQLDMFKCLRTGLNNEAMPYSGYHIVHRVWWDTRWKYQFTKVGAATTVLGRSTAAGSGSITGPVHNF